MTIQHYKINQASLIAAFTFAVGQVCAIVPQWSSEKQVLISAGTTVISGLWLLANAVHALIAARVSGKDLEADLEGFAQAEIGKINFNDLVAAATKANGLKGLEGELEASVQAELRKILGQAPAPAPAPTPSAPGPVPGPVQASPPEVAPPPQAAPQQP